MAESLFVIDSTFLLETSRNTFRGAPLLQDSSGRDTTMLFGFARDLLRMRQRVGMRRALIVIGDEPCLPDSLVSDAIGFLKRLRVPVLCAKDVRVGDVCAALAIGNFLTLAKWRGDYWEQKSNGTATSSKKSRHSSMFPSKISSNMHVPMLTCRSGYFIV